MNLAELETHLRAEGYGALIDQRGAWGLSVGDLRIERSESTVTVAWTERGEITDLLLETSDEAAACRRFVDTLARRKLHFRTFRDASAADALTARLRAGGIEVWRNDIPNFNGPGDARYRLFVDGADLRRAAERAPAAQNGLAE